jgi:hypothetical protein
MDVLIRSYCFTCVVCQLRVPVKVSDRMPITTIPRKDELPFTHLETIVLAQYYQRQIIRPRKPSTIMR